MSLANLARSTRDEVALSILANRLDDIAAQLLEINASVNRRYREWGDQPAPTIQGATDRLKTLANQLSTKGQ